MTTASTTFPFAEEQLSPITPRARLARSGGWWTLLLILAMAAAMTGSLTAAAWSEGLSAVQLVTFSAVLTGFALALTRWSGGFAFAYGSVMSVFVISNVASRLLHPSLHLHDALRELAIRNVDWLRALVSGQAGADNTVFVTQLCVLGWWIGFLASWDLIRHQRVLTGVLPAGVALFVNSYYSARPMGAFLVAYLVAVVLLAIGIELARNETRWQTARIRYAPDIYLDFLRAGLIFAALMVGLAWTLPGLAEQVVLERATRPFEAAWQKVEDTWGRMYRSLNYGQQPVQSAAFGKSTKLGGPVSLTDRPIFEAETPVRTYWRAATYDTYNGEGWLNTDGTVRSYDRFEPLLEPDAYGVRVITATIRALQERQRQLLVPPQPLAVSLPVDAQVRKIAGTDGRATVSLLESRIILTPDSLYQVRSAITAASSDELRAARVDYPAWVMERYLQLPPSVPERVRQLGIELTSGTTNTFDAASAIEARLREYTYNQQIAAPPPGADGADYFLFELKEGYCDYYATAMVVLLRTVGIPARYVAGYAPGEILPPPEGASQLDTTYRVLERNAHAWVEVYFPDYGWIQFEPTASESPLVRPSPRPELSPLAGRDDPATPEEAQVDDLRPDRGDLLEAPTSTGATTIIAWITARWPIVALAIAGLGVVVGGLLVWWRRRQALWGDTELPIRLFQALGRWATRLRLSWPPSRTANEHAVTFGGALPESAPAFARRATLYTAQRYGRQSPNPEQLRATAEDWRRSEPRLWRAWLKRFTKWGDRRSGSNR